MTRMFLLILFILPVIAAGQVEYSDYFTKKQLRFDFSFGGNEDSVIVYPEQIKQEPFWAGSQKNLIDPFNYGTYRFRVSDFDSGELIFSKGFSPLFQEWQTTVEAKSNDKTFYQAVMFPFPKKRVWLDIEARQWDGNFKTIYSVVIDPRNYFILNEKAKPFETTPILSNGEPANKVDLTILAEGYTEREMQKFIDDCQNITEYLFDLEPFKSEESNFNVNAVFVPSLESGTDVPGEKIYKNTAFNSSFYTFDTPRYLTTSDMKSVYDAAAAVPTDQIYVLVNSERYGGGGFYNFISVCTSDNELSKEVFVHEFGHGLAGLGDEYYTSDVAFQDYYNTDTEPWEANLTTLVNFSSKWENKIDDTVPIPTPREPDYQNVIGAFEGGGYMEKGIFSPFMDCRMKTNTAADFCPVCREAITEVIRYYSE